MAATGILAAPVRRMLDTRPVLLSCHAARGDGFVLEGRVPAPRGDTSGEDAGRMARRPGLTAGIGRSGRRCRPATCFVMRA